jgi:hypothetical protein
MISPILLRASGSWIDISMPGIGVPQEPTLTRPKGLMVMIGAVSVMP